ncbi:VOC family protein [Embleya sp. NPDC050154]|uniref:VOC family protein n=1 Tax=Embleya sp. NPDC050154 TaxID=3363988 RepID=UPI0037B80447
MAARMPILTFLMGLGSESAMDDHPQLVQTVLDTTEPRILVEFYRLLLGLSYRPGDEPPVEGASDDADGLVLRDADGTNKLAFRHGDHLTRTTWPRHDVLMQMHLDLAVPGTTDLHTQRERAQSRGAVPA